VLNANGPGSTYELINSVLAPNGGDVVENPECVHPEFGRHIAEVWDNELNQYVFEFYMHVTPDNDRCINFDRQRLEIKTYDASPASLKGNIGETIEYKWKLSFCMILVDLTPTLSKWRGSRLFCANFCLFFKYSFNYHINSSSHHHIRCLLSVVRCLS
jgi:hypothetical protein